MSASLQQVLLASGGRSKGALYNTLSSLGLLTNLKLCLDAGAGLSYDPAVQTSKWLDLTENGFDFFRGATGSVEASDPFFHGIADLGSKEEYFSFDSGDYFTYDGNNEPWMEALHKAGALFSFFAWVYIPTSAPIGQIVGTAGTANNTTGFHFGIATQGWYLPTLVVHNNGNNVLMINFGSFGWSAGWKFLCGSVNELSHSHFIGVGDWYQTSTSPFNNPSTGNATYPMQIGAAGNAQTPLPVNSRMAAFAMWQGGALTQANMNAIRTATEPRFA